MNPNDAAWNEVWERLSRIKTLADRAGTLAEAEAAAAALSRLLLKYNLSMADLDAGPGAEAGAEAVGSEEYAVANSAPWRHYLLHALAQSHFCRAVRYPGTNRAILVGHPHNLAAVKELYRWLSVAIERLSSEAWEELRDRDAARLLLDPAAGHRRFADARAALPGASARRGWTDAFRTGAVDGLWRRLIDERAALERETDPASWALVPIIDAEVQDFMNQHFASVGSYQMRARDTAGYNAGQEAGYSLDITKAGLPTGR